MTEPRAAGSTGARWWKGRWWEGWPWRLIQTNLREIDMRDIDAERYVASLRWFGATVAMINTSGIIASYPTALEAHTPSAFLQGDALTTIVDACHAAGIKVIARTDFSKVRRSLYERHPAWAYVGDDGRILDEHGDVHVCINGGYARDHVPRIVEETITSLDVDGIYINMAGVQGWDYAGGYHGLCRCTNCVERFGEVTGLPLPGTEDLDDPVYRRYVVFRERTLRAHDERLHELIRGLRPGIAIDRSFDDGRGYVRMESNTALDRPLPDWQYSASDHTRWVRGTYPRMVPSNSSVDFIDYPVRHVSVSPDRQALRLAQALANGGGLDYYVIGRLDDHADRSAFDAVREVFGYHAANEERYRDLRPVATTALLTGPWGNGEEYRGWFRVLAEHHFPFDVVDVGVLGAGVPLRYRTIVVPDLQPIGEEAARGIDAFVRDGGTLVASGRAGFRDDAYEPREAPGLASLGMERVDGVRTEVRGSYFQIGDEEGFGRLGAGGLVYLDGVYVDARYGHGTRGLLRMIPPGPFGPPERCYQDEVTGEPALVAHPFGRGTAWYVPWLCGAQFHAHGHPNTAAFAADVLEHHAGAARLGGNLSPMVEATLMEDTTGHRLLLHLVNGSGHYGNGYVPPVPMRGVEVTIGSEGEPADVRALVAGRGCSWHAGDGGLTVRIDELGAFEAVEILRRGRSA